jgi:outer membrane biosynthesis protein TonB
MRRYAPVGLVLAVLIGLMLMLPASSEPSSGDGAPSREEFDALAARVTTLEEQVAELQAGPPATPTETPTSSPTETPTETPTSTPSETPTETPSDSPTSSPTETPSDSPTSTPTETPTTDPSETPTPDPDGPPSAADFPTPDSVGPATEPTQAWTGGCTVTTDGLVIEGVVVSCPGGLVMGNVNGDGAPDRSVQGVVIRDSVVNGGVFTSEVDTDDVAGNNPLHPQIFSIESSRVLCAPERDSCRAVGLAHYSVRDSYLRGTHSGGWAHNKVVIEDSYITTTGTSTHQSGIRMLKNSTLRGNTIFCTPAGSDVDGGCSADGVFYREFGVPGNLAIEGNYFRRGSGQGQWFATRFIDCQLVDVCVNIRMTGNLFDRGQGTDGGEFPNDAGDVWADNYWVDGEPARSGQAR